MSRNAQGWLAASAFLAFAVIMGALRLFLNGMSTDFVYGTVFGACLMAGGLGISLRRVRELG